MKNTNSVNKQERSESHDGKGRHVLRTQPCSKMIHPNLHLLFVVFQLVAPVVMYPLKSALLLRSAKLEIGRTDEGAG